MPSGRGRTVPICTPVVFNYVTFLNQRTPGALEELIGSCQGNPVPATSPPALVTFTEQCKTAGDTAATTAVTPPVMGQMPTTEGGWTCTTPTTQCVSLLTYSGSEYEGGPAGCPQDGLGPTLATVVVPPDNSGAPSDNSAAPGDSSVSF